MNKNEKIYVAGHTGMAGSAILRNLKKKGYNNFVLYPHKKLDLINQKDVFDFFFKEKPRYVFIAAGKVGGINANNNLRGQFIYENLMIQNNIIHASHEFNVKKLIFLGSACIYPRNSNQPIKEEYLLTGVLEPTNEPYAIAKIAGIKLCESYFRQYGNNFVSIMPNNLYGPNDNFDLEASHVIPALLQKIHKAKIQNSKIAEVWGSGLPKREFLHVDDFADACVFLMNNLDAKQLYGKNIAHINIGSGEEVSIKELAFIIKDIIGYKGDLYFNTSFPDGMPRKLLDINNLVSLGWKPKIDLNQGICSVYDWYIKHREGN